MAFFGITSLGPPNNFQTSLVSALGINVFSEEEFLQAFAKVDKDNSGFITPDEVEDLLQTTYGFPPLEEEVELFMQEFDLNADGKVSQEEFVATLGRMKKMMEQKS